MRPYLAPLALVAASLILSACDPGDWDSGDRYRSDFRYTYAMQPGGALALENYNGSVEIEAWDQNSIEITGTKYARTEALRDAIKIEIEHSDTSVSIRTVRPFDHSGNMGARYILRVPRKIRLDRVTSTNGSLRVNGIEGLARVRSSNGSIRLNRISGEVEAQTTNGPIELDDIKGSATLHTSNGHVNASSLTGPVEATTTNGSIRIHESTADLRAPLRLSTSNAPIDLTLDGSPTSDIRANTTNGSITLHMSREATARVRAATSNSSITSDFDVTMQGRFDKHHLEGAINNGSSGAPLLDLTTSNGSIRLLKM